jgi:two-component system response regulator CpxR
MSPWSDLEGVPKVMLVDDEKEFVHTLSERLRTRSLESSIAYDGEQALEMIEKDLPDVMVLDLMMPGIDGIEVLRRIKRDHPEVEVIILTGHGSDREKQLAEELGAFAYLNKPVDVDLLARVMREAYGRAGRTGDSGDETKRDP